MSLSGKLRSVRDASKKRRIFLSQRFFISARTLTKPPALATIFLGGVFAKSGSGTFAVSHEQIRAWLKLPTGKWPPDHYTLLGVPPGETDLERIQEQAQKRMELVRPYQHRHPEEVTEAMNRLAQAMVCLTDPNAKKAYDNLLWPPPPVRKAEATSRRTSETNDYFPAKRRRRRLQLPIEEPRRRSRLWPWLLLLSGLVVLGVLIAAIWLISQGPAGNTEKPPSLPQATVLKLFQDFKGPVWGVAFSPDGKTILAACDNGVVYLGDVDKGTKVPCLEHRDNNGKASPVRCVAFSPDGKRFLSGGDDCSVRLGNLDSGEGFVLFPVHSGVVTCVAFSPDGTRAISGSEDLTVRTWDVESHQELQRCKGHQGTIMNVAFFSDDKRGVSCARDNTVRVWDLAVGRNLREMTSDNVGFRCGAVTSDARFALVCDGKILLRFDLSGETKLRSLRVPLEEVTSLAVSRDGRRALAGSADGSVRLLDLDNGSELCRGLGHQGSVTSVTFSHDQRRALSGGTDNTVRVWELPNSSDSPGHK